MGIKNNGKCIEIIRGKEINDSKKEEINKSIYINQYSIKIKELYKNLVGKEIKYEKLIYTVMLAEQCSLYDDMFYFIKEIMKKRRKILDRDERNLLNTSCKNSI